MPGPMDGFQLAREARTRYPELKILLTSGFPETRLADNQEIVSRVKLLSKPYRRDDLARTIRALLDERTGGASVSAGE
jgi:CheY-like chemotaxis protein